MKSKFAIKPILGAVAIVILAAGCQLPSSGGANSSDNATNTSSNTADVQEVSHRMSDLNLTNAQKTQMKQIREQTRAKIVGILSPDQQQQFKAATQGKHESPMKELRSLNLSDTQKQQVRDIMSAQRQQINAILTPDQQAKMKQHRTSKDQSSSGSSEQ
jgi:Spy/CpxP family protein refolding chaperone